MAVAVKERVGKKRVSQETRIAALAYVLASRSFEDFLDHVWIMEPPPGGGRIKFVKWSHLMGMAKKLVINRLLIILKARQIGFSWLVAAYVAWTILFKEGAVVLMLSKGQDEARTILGKVRFVLRNLPEGWLPALGVDSRGEITIPSMNSKVTALPATEDAGRSETATLVIQDEADFHEYLDTNYAAVKPTIDAGGQMVMGSTSNKRKMTSLFKDLYRRAKAKESGEGWVHIFFPWHVRPERDVEWYERTKADVPATDDMSPELYMEQEYPNSEDEALAPSRVLAAFDHDVLKQMEADAREPMRIMDGVVRIYRGWQIGSRYACGTDTSHGVGQDFSASVVVDVQSGYVCADILSNTLPPEELAWHTMEMLKVYKNPLWAVEDNDWGIVAIKAAQRERYPRLYKRKTSRHGADKVGWHTDTRSRYTLWGELIEATNAGLIVVPNSKGLSQFYSVIRNPNQDGRIEAMEGAHDDYPMAVAIAWQMRKHAYAGVTGGKIIQMPKMW